MKRMNRKEKIQACIEFFNTIAGLLSETHEVVESCNQDISQYLIPFGSIQDLSYASKPANSFRISDHWNWYSNLMKNPDEHYIQCFSVDAPWANPRKTRLEHLDRTIDIMRCSVKCLIVRLINGLGLNLLLKRFLQISTCFRTVHDI